jgi:hypothetical protein
VEALNFCYQAGHSKNRRQRYRVFRPLSGSGAAYFVGQAVRGASRRQAKASADRTLQKYLSNW